MPWHRKVCNTIFTKERFWGTDEEWAMIKPAVWLASKLFQTPLSQRFIVGLIWDSKKRLPQEFDFEGKPSFQFHSSERPDGEVAFLFQDLVHDVAEFNFFGPFDLNRLKTGANAHAMCGRYIPLKGSNFLPGADPMERGRPGHRTW